MLVIPYTLPGSSPLPPMSAAARKKMKLGPKDCLCGPHQLMIYDDPTMTQLGHPAGGMVLPPVGAAMPMPLALSNHPLGGLGGLAGLAGGQCEGTTAGAMGARAPLPAEEIRIYLEQKLRELERTDSALSGR